MSQEEELGISPETMEEYRELFSWFDKDEDGSISCSELGKALQFMGQNPTKAEIQGIIKEADRDGSGKLEFLEFCSLIHKKITEDKEVDQEEELMNAFRTFDRNGDGYITADELRFMMSGLGEQMTDEEIDEMMKEADEDGDGRVCYKEFVKMCVQK